MIAHTGDTDDLDHIEELLALGPYIGMDRYGTAIFLPDEQRNTTVAELCRRGYASRMVLSQDACATIDWFPEELIAAARAELELHLHLRADPRPAARRSASATRTSTRCSTRPRCAGWRATDRQNERGPAGAGPLPSHVRGSSPETSAAGRDRDLAHREARREQRHAERGVERVAGLPWRAARRR